MSTTRGAVKLSVRRLIGDLRSGDYQVPDERLNAFVQFHVERLLSELDEPSTAQASALTTSAGNSDYTLSSAAEYLVIASLVRNADRVPLSPRSWESMDQLRYGTTLQASGKPTDYALMESPAQVVTVRLWPVPNGAYAIDAVWSLAQGALSSDSSTIPFSSLAARALELRVAGDAVDSLDSESTDALRLNPKSAAVYRNQAEAILAQEVQRKAAQRRQDRIERVTA